MLPDKKLAKAELYKIIQSGGFLGKTLGNLDKESIIRPWCPIG